MSTAPSPTATGLAVTTNQPSAIAPRTELTLTPDQIDLVKRTVAKGATDDELALFLHQARRMGLDPLARQIHAVKRWDRTQQREAMAIQVGIDGYRLIAERTGTYCPARAPTFETDAEGRLVSATAYALKLVGGEWHEISATAFYAEYVQTRKDGTPTSMWERMPRSQTAKCAEALVLRKGWPAELSGAYTHEEMAQAADPAPPASTRALQADLAAVQASEREATAASAPAEPLEDAPGAEPRAPGEAVVAAAQKAVKLTDSQLRAIRSIARSKGMTPEATEAFTRRQYSTAPEGLTIDEASHVIKELQRL